MSSRLWSYVKLQFMVVLLKYWDGWRSVDRSPSPAVHVALLPSDA